MLLGKVLHSLCLQVYVRFGDCLLPAVSFIYLIFCLMNSGLYRCKRFCRSNTRNSTFVYLYPEAGFFLDMRLEVEGQLRFVLIMGGMNSLQDSCAEVKTVSDAFS